MAPAQLEQTLGHAFARPELLRQALTHRSHSSPHNERLEFLGDSVLSCCVATLLFQQFPNLNEGELSRLRASLVRQEALAEIASGLQLGQMLRLGEGELKSGGFRRPSILADALEAVFGAIYLDAGFDAALRVISALYRERLGQLDPRAEGKDAKTALQEWLQGRRLPLPHYALLATRGEAHAQEFEVSCSIPALDLVATGRGASRRAAEQQAARAALERLRSA
ncbi:MAG: ribonuclease III [Rhodocyclaceae bacterium]|nr:ribonuclease III [Rhodocyclaceae bacterium]